MMLEPHLTGGVTSGVGLALGPTGLSILSCASGGGVALTEVRAGRPRRLRGSGPAQSCVRAFDGGGLTAGEDGAVCVWDPERQVAERRPDQSPETAPGGASSSDAPVAPAKEELVDLSETTGMDPRPPPANGAEVQPSAIRAMHLWAGETVRLVTGHANGQLCWWG